MTTPRDSLLLTLSEVGPETGGRAFVEVLPWRVMADGDDPIRGSIPGAVVARVADQFAGRPSRERGHLPLPEPGAVRRWMSTHGILPRHEIVVYTRRVEEFSSATRAWFVLRASGFACVRVLDGGLPAWVDAGGRLGRPGQRASAVALHGGEHLASTEVVAIDADRAFETSRIGVLLDGRSADAYLGDDGLPRSGHIPHAVHAPWTDVLTVDGRLGSPLALRRWLLARGAVGAHRVGAYCGGGVASSAIVFAAATIGQRIELFVASWSAWELDRDRPVERGGRASRSALIDPDCTLERAHAQAPGADSDGEEFG